MYFVDYKVLDGIVNVADLNLNNRKIESNKELKSEK